MQLILGDCLEKMKYIPAQSVDMVLTDPPYGTTACKWDTVIPFEPMWKELKRIIKPKGVILLFGSEPFSSLLRVSNLKQFKYDWVWDKVKSTQPHLSKHQPMKRHETISVFSYGVINYIPQMVKKDKPRKAYGSKMTAENAHGLGLKPMEPYFITHSFPTTIISFSNADNTIRVHPTQKPVALLEYLIKTYTLEGETVLDFTMGSGSTGVACKNLNRNFIGIEKDDKYFEIAKKRIEEHLTTAST